MADYAPIVPLNTLGDVYGMNPGAFGKAQELLKNAQLREAQGLADMLAKSQREAQMHPLEMQRRQADLESIAAGTEATRATTKSTQLKNQYDEAILPAQIKSQLDDFANKADENQFNQIMRELERGAMDPDPIKREKALTALNYTKEARAARGKYESEMAVTKQQGANAANVARINADSRREIAQLRADSAKELTKIKDAVDKKNTDQLIAEYVQKAQAAQTPEEREYYNSLATITATLRAQGTAQGQRPMIDPAQLPGAPLRNPQVPQVPAPPGAAPATVPQGRVRVISPDGKVGTIPASQLEAAKAAGYKETK